MISTLVAGGIALFQYQRAEKLERELLRMQAGMFQRQLDAASVASDQPEHTEENVVGPAVAGGSTGERAEDTETESLPVDPSKVAQARRAIMAKPSYQRAVQLKQDAWVEEKYGALFAQLQLDPAKLNNLRRLLLDRRFASRDVRMVAEELGLGAEQNAELRKLSEENRLEIDAEIQAMLGEQGYGKLSAYEGTVNQRAIIDRLESRLSYSQSPLNAAQNQALYDLFSPSGSGASGAGPNRVWSLTEDSLTQAQAVLSAEQLEVLQILMEEQTVERTLNEARAEIRALLQSPTDPSGKSGG